jgi:hypothetical protein
MLQSKTARLLSTFDKKEYPAIERFLEAANRGPADTMQVLFRFLCSCQDRKITDDAEAEFIRDSLGWDEKDPATAAKVNYALHQLKLSLEDYLLHDYHRQQELAREKALMAAFRYRQASEFVLEASARVDKLIESISLGPTYYDAEAELINVQFNHPYPNQFARRKYDIQDVIRAYRRNHLSLSLVHHWNMLLESTQFSGIDDAKAQSIQRVLESVETDPEFAAAPFQLAYSLALRSVFEKQQSLATFHAIRDAAARILPHAPAHDVMALMNMQINYLLLMQTVSSTPHYEELLALYSLGLENGGLFKDGYLSYADFMNMILVSSQIKRMGWAKDLIDRYGDRLNPAIREQVLPLARARVAYFGGDPAAALRMLGPSRKALSDPDKIYEKFLRSYCYYELGQDDLLDAHLEAFRKFILRHKNLGEQLRKTPADFIRLLRRLMAATDATTLHDIQNELARMPAIYAFNWLSEKIQQRLARLN